MEKYEEIAVNTSMNSEIILKFCIFTPLIVLYNHNIMDKLLFPAHLISQQGKLAAAGSIVVIKHPGFAAAVWATQFTESAWCRRAAVARRHAGQGGRHRDGGHRDAGSARHWWLVVVGEWRGETGGRKGRSVSGWSRDGWVSVLQYNDTVNLVFSLSLWPD